MPIGLPKRSIEILRERNKFDANIVLYINGRLFMYLESKRSQINTDILPLLGFPHDFLFFPTTHVLPYVALVPDMTQLLFEAN